ncbi:MAG TPA: response regulator [Geobacteraceae bacterium]
MATDKKQLGDLLVEAGIITTKTLERALERQKGSGKRIGIVLEDMGVLTDEELVEALARQFNFKTAKNLVSYTFPPELLALVPEDMAVTKLVFPLRHRDGMLAVAITDPFDGETLEYLAKKNNVKVFPILATRDDILAALRKFYLQGREVTPSKARILVVDDSPAVATIIKVALEKEGYDVTVGRDGVEGLKLALAERPDLVICDAIMPRLDGFGFKRAMEANPQTAAVPIILLTSKASGEDEQKALEAGFLDFIPKPVQPIRVVSRVKRAFTIFKSMQK